MKQRTLFKGGWIVLPDNTFFGDILITDDRITQIGTSISVEGKYTEINCDDMIIFPGLIDDQVHFREPGLMHKATLYSESRAAVAGGTTSFIDQPNVKPPTSTIALLQKKIESATRSSVANFGFNLGALNDNIDDLRFAVEKHSRIFPAIKVFMGSSTGNILVDNPKVLEEIFKLDKLIITHCEDEDTVHRNEEIYVKKYGENVPVKYHPLIRSVEACLKSSRLAVGLAQKHNSRLHVYHITTADELVLFKNDIPIEKKRITAEVCVHHLWFSADDYERLGSQIRCNPAIKDKKHKAMLLDAVIGNWIDVIATDHAPHTWEEKQNPYFSCPSGVPLVQHNLMALYEMHIKDPRLTLSKITEKASKNPATLLRIKDRGELAEGYYADIVIFDPNTPYTVTKENIRYKCGWSPFEGHTFPGSVKSTYVNGVLTYHDGKVQSCFPNTGRALTFGD